MLECWGSFPRSSLCINSAREKKNGFCFAKAGKTPQRSGNTHRERDSVQGSSFEDKNRRRFAEPNLQPAQQTCTTRDFSSRPNGAFPNRSDSRSQNLLEAQETYIPKCLGAREEGKR